MSLHVIEKAAPLLMNRLPICFLRIALALAAFSFPACRANKSDMRKTANISDAETMRRVLQEALPFGTELAAARTFMEGEGFRCEPKADARWLDRSHLDYLHCERSDGGVVQQRWQVAIVRIGNGVSEILVTTGLVGP